MQSKSRLILRVSETVNKKIIIIKLESVAVRACKITRWRCTGVGLHTGTGMNRSVRKQVINL